MKGRPTGSKKTDPMLQQIAVRLSADLLEKLESEAKAKHIPSSTLIRLILSERYDVLARDFIMLDSIMNDARKRMEEEHEVNRSGN